jgi:hypothetical protein
MAGAVMAGCLVASVKCSSWISMKLAAYITLGPEAAPEGRQAQATIMNLSSVVKAVTAPPPMALPSISRYSPRVRVM